MNKISNQSRVLVVSLSSRGFGYAVMEGNARIIDYGHKVFSKDKNDKSLAHIEKMIIRNQPDALALQASTTKGSRRAPRIKKLHGYVIALAKNRKLKVVQISGTALRNKLISDVEGTQYELAKLLAKQFPDELASRLPPKRKTWKSEDARMDIFDAVGLAVVILAQLRVQHLRDAAIVTIT